MCELAFGCRLIGGGGWARGFLFTRNYIKSSKIELASGCQLLVASFKEIVNWHLSLFATVLLSFNRFKYSEIELAAGCQFPVANSQKCANWHLVAICLFPIYLIMSEIL